MAISVVNLPTTIPSTTVLPPVPINTVNAASYTFQGVDGNAYTLFNVPSVSTATILANTFPIGMKLTVELGGVGNVTIKGGLGVTLQPNSVVSFLVQHSVGHFTQVALNVWTFEFATATISTIGVASAVARTQRSIVTSGDLPIGNSDQILNMNAVTDLTPVVPLASGRAGQSLTIKNLPSAHTQTITRTAPDTFDGVTVYTLNGGSAVTFVPYTDGVNSGYAIE